MCGLVGISGSSQIERAILASMLNEQQHRGPDDSGNIILDNGCVGLGHVRLSIIDTTQAGHQPMSSSCGRYIIVFNGEIYNYKELKHYISLKYNFTSWQSSTDTEVVLEGYAFEGEKFIEKLNGVFAIAIYDIQLSHLFVVRDIVGVKPLYYIEKNNTFYFASELKSLLKLNLEQSLRIESLQEQLQFMYVPEPYTMFQNYFKFTPGEYRVYEKGKLIKNGFLDSSYHHIDYCFKSEEEYVEQLDCLLNSAVEKQLMSDVPVSLFLSGGLDSSLISAIALKNGTCIKEAYTISCSDEDRKYDQYGNDLFYANKIAKELGLNLNIIKARSNMLEMLPEVVYHLDDALSDPAAINTYVISKAARDKGYRVMLSGQGADEILGGYRKYRAEMLYRSFPQLALQIIAPLEHLIPNSIPGPFNAISRQCKKFLHNMRKEGNQRMIELSIWNDLKCIAALFLDTNSLSQNNFRFEILNDYKKLSPIEAMMRLDEKLYLPSHNLLYTDRMSMMAGVEARVPFLDLSILDFAHQLPVNLKLRGNTQKYILKKVAETYLPSSVIYRSKTGFGSPIRSWFREDNELIKKYFDKDYLRKQDIFNSTKVQKFKSENIAGKADNSYSLYALLNFQIWYDIFVNKQKIF